MSSETFVAFCAAGLWPGLDRATAARLADAGVDTPDAVDAQRLAGVAGLDAARAARLAAAFTAARPLYEVAELLVPAGVPARLAASAVRHLGDSAAQRLREDPWRLLALPEVRPDQADHFARRVLAEPVDLSDVRRGRALVAYLLTRATRDGHTVSPARQVAAALAGFGVDDAVAAVAGALDDGAVMMFDSPQGRTLALTRLALAEESVAEAVGRLLATAKPFADDEQIAAQTAQAELDEAQRAAVAAAAQHGLSILTGGPGTGKSRTVATLVALAEGRGLRVALAAPTGRAAKRLEELTQASATTVHRLLGAQGTTGEFAHGEDWPLEADLVVVDEASMLDAELAAALLEACPDGAHLMLVGDPAQLPSIGPGRVLADLIDSGVVAVTELRTLYRQRDGGCIARLAAGVRAGELPPVDSPDREVVVVPARDGGEAAHRVVQLVTDSIPRALGIPAEDIQVVTPVHRGAAGTLALNQALKARLNPGPGGQGGFDPGDRVVAVANHVDEGFANGEVGVVTAVSEVALTVCFAGEEVSVPRRLWADLRHGWAVTIHRAQGSEWPAVVTVLPGEAAGMLSRPLLYTALTRARQHLSVVHAAGPALARAVRTIGERPRRTRLAGLLRETAAHRGEAPVS